MEPQPPPAARCPATYAPQHHQRGHPNATPNDYEHTYSEKDAYQRQLDPRLQRGSKGSNGRSHDSVISQPFSPKPSSPPSPTSSVSSAGRKHPSRLEAQQAVRVPYPPQAHIDPEKAHVSRHGRPSPSYVSSPNPDVTAPLYEKGPEEKPLQLLLFLSGPCACLSFAITLWTVLSTFVALLLQPLRLCTTRPSFSSQITSFLAPPLNLQLQLVYSFSSGTDYSPPMLIVVHLFAPIVASGVAIAAWTAAFFWFFSAILGDPAGQDGHNDGKESILGVRTWWDRWLSRALR